MSEEKKLIATGPLNKLTSLMSIFKRVPLHPFLFGIYPVLAMLAYNLGQVDPILSVRSMIVVILMTFLFLFITRLILRDWLKAAIFVAILNLLFFSYGHVYNAVKGFEILGVLIGRQLVLLPLWLCLLLVGWWWITRWQRIPDYLTRALNFVGIVAIIFPIYQIANFRLQISTPLSNELIAPSTDIHLPSVSGSLRVPDGKFPPDIYYIILDMYVRDDILRDVFMYDNSSFLDGIRDLGFYVAHCSQSNYSDTPLSVTSTLNMNYLETFAGDFIHKELDHYRIEPYVNENLVREELENLGYKIINIESGFFLTEWQDADLYLSGEDDTKLYSLAFGGLNIFEGMLFHSTVGMWIFENRTVLPDSFIPILDQTYIDHRNRIIYAFDNLEKMASIPGPKFVLVHFMVPHPPFVFGPTGEFVPRNTPLTFNYDVELFDWNRYVNGYTGQLTYLNQRVEVFLQKILGESEVSPIIILQADHGTTKVDSPRERMAILNAFYLPKNVERNLYPTISPVNSFRLIFDTYFDGDYGLLKDISYLNQSGKGPYDFIVVPNTLQDCEEY